MTDTTVPFALYDAFTDVPFGGSQGGIVLNANDFDADTRQKIASELGLPATCFVSSVSDNTITARFHSTEREYPMCGHGTICLIAHLLEKGMLHIGDKGTLNVDLVLPSRTAPIEVLRQNGGKNLVLLNIDVPKIRCDNPATNDLARLLGFKDSDISNSYPVETALGDFVHLIIPVKNLKAMQAIDPDFSVMKDYCNENGVETIACFCPETVQAGFDFHVRDFCPAVGVTESAAAGTTNAALATYWHRHGLVLIGDDGQINLKVEQGLELNRPSTIHIIIHANENHIIGLQVGGVARKVIEGQLFLPTSATEIL